MADEIGTYVPITPIKPERDHMEDRDRVMERAAEGLRKKRQQDQGGGEEDSGGHGEGHGHEDISDDILVLGIPNAEMTDNVRHALTTLLDEINHLRTQLMQAKGHEAFLEAQAEGDEKLHVLFRRPFLARLMLAARRATENGGQFMLLYFSALNADDVRQDLGPVAVQALLTQMAEAISEGLEPGDILGNLENSDFGVLLPGTQVEEGIVKANAILDIIKGRTLRWQEQKLVIDAVCGTSAIFPGDAALEVIERAQRDVRTLDQPT